ncbi:F-BAR domain only protein 2-like isoform X1 [Carcharodon carcharias]|uniref:F-BAR domain only protein 2-like isoform X1 n=2 Tax=Carcharodon carcharias TaxID=13397 RepID=UPI001B7DF8B7|nr:F-BAR domain only protein 2-like isoform X1 [Carcharodon carcharias]
MKGQGPNVAYFMGEKNNGFDVLYHNMKHGQISVKELADFVRERALIEESYSKSMSKLSKMVTNSSLGTFAPMWEVFRTSADKLALCHFELVRKLHDLIKEMNRFNEEQIKMHRKTKEEVSGTLEAVQNVQSSVQLLQKCKDNYHSKWLEWDRLKKDGASQKEIDKAELKSKKAAESYKASIEKYRTARSDYQQKMAEAAQKFQQVEEIHLRHMKGLIKSYSHSIEDTHVQVGQVHEEFKQNVENIRVQDLIQKYALTKGTGKEKPGNGSVFPKERRVTGVCFLPGQKEGPIEFEECNPEVVLEAAKKSKRKSFVIPGLGKREKDTDSTGSPDADSINSPEVDEEGYTIRPDIVQNDERETQPCSSSDSDFDDDEPRKFHIEIKPVTVKEWTHDPATSVEQLRASIGNIVLTSNPIIPSKRNSTRHSIQLAPLSVEGNSEGIRPRDVEAATFRFTAPSSEPSRTIVSQNGVGFLDPLFGPSLDSMFEKPGLAAQCNQLNVNPLSLSAPTGSSGLEIVEDSGLDSPSLPTTNGSSPSPESRPWTPQTVTPPVSLPLSNFSPTCNETSFHPVCSLKSNEETSTDLQLNSDQGHDPPLAEREQSPVDPCSEADLSTPALHVMAATPATGIPNVQAEASVREPAPVAPPRRHSKKKLFPIPLEGMDESRSVSPSTVTSPSSPPAAALSQVDEAATTHSCRNRASTPASCISRGPSPVTVGNHEALPIAAAFTECIDAYFRGGDFANVIVKLTGDVTMSFPAGIVRIFSGNSSPAVISFRLLNANRITQFLPNSQLLYSDLSQSDSEVKDFWLNMPSLTAQLQKQAKQNPSTSYFNISLLKYQVSTLDCPALPLKVAARWKCESNYTEVTMDYEYDTQTTATALRNLHALVPLEGAVSNVQSHPTAVWNSKQKRLWWKLPDICSQSGTEGKGLLRASWEVADGPSKPSPLALQFTSEGSTLSGADICLLGGGYRLSLVKKKLVTEFQVGFGSWRFEMPRGSCASNCVSVNTDGGQLPAVRSRLYTEPSNKN